MRILELFGLVSSSDHRGQIQALDQSWRNVLAAREERVSELESQINHAMAVLSGNLGITEEGQRPRVPTRAEWGSGLPYAQELTLDMT